MIREEALKLFDEGHIRAASGYNDIGFNTFFKRGWKRFYLKWYGDFLPSASALCPKTAELLAKIPSINAAMFTRSAAGLAARGAPRSIRGLVAISPRPGHAELARVLHHRRRSKVLLEGWRSGDVR